MSTEGLFISKKKVINQINHKSYSLSLLATGGNVDVVIYDIRDDKPCNICPGENPDLMEFYYVLEGTVILKMDDGDVVLEKDEYFYVYNLLGIINFSTIHGAKLLNVSSQPMFKYLTDFHEGLGKLRESTELKDLYTYNHGYRVQMYSVKIGEKLKLSQESIYILQVSSLFHDIGKNNVPDNILKKPDKLTYDEYECIKKHSANSCMLLKGMFDETILRAVEQHHERLDGSGYPMALVDGQIMFEAKVIAVADAFDAITSDRAYRRGLSPLLAFQELEKVSGSQYDETVVNALREVLVDEGAF